MVSIAITVVAGNADGLSCSPGTAFPGRDVLSEPSSICRLCLPPAVAGLALLMAFGRRGIAGGLLVLVGHFAPLFCRVAVVVAQIFVAAPFYVRGASVGFAGVDKRLEQMAATLGYAELVDILEGHRPVGRPEPSSAVPLMSWTRALGEFGATIMFAGNFQGRTQTMPLAIYIGLASRIWQGPPPWPPFC